jgi:type I restriction-modification system DNA methylase subunit
MALFQKSVLNKFIKSQDTVKIEAAYQRFSDNFQKAERQAEIRSMKEEEYQDGFLDDLFVNILGYIKRPNAGFNLVREKKNEADSKKADGAILKNDMPLAVIELKGTDTTDLDKVTNQGFGYKNNHKECVYVVISNFEKLRFFIHHAVDYIEFNLFTLSKEDFTTLWLCLHSDNLLDNIPAKIKAESVVKEEDITKNLYKDYSTFKQELWQSIVSLNPEGDPLMFYKKTQKLIDRFLFIFFAEDAGLLPPNSISRMVERWQMLKDEDAYKPLYDIFKQYFGYINTGRPGKTPQDEIFAYNGGLMLEDDVLESITISDDVLLKHVSRLTTYDFSSEVDVNILGHIFENSLNDIEAVTAELEGQEIDKSKTKRKKDGVFYTPKYITKYIVDNTVGKLCDEKKVELNIIDEEYAKGRNNRKKETLKQLDENLQAYRNWLLNITICDPACGSGAFLNQALEYLMEEHRYIDELESQLLGAGFTFPGVENHILENNIFGVDINEESIEIAKLSLWLRTAQRGRKLTSLNNNIKCGNSLIDDPEVAGDKAFSWHKEFPSVFEKSSAEPGRSSGFDVVIGNPPYVRPHNIADKEKVFLWSNYFVASQKTDLYAFFTEKGALILKSKGILGYIMPKTWMSIHSFAKLRQLILESYSINQIGLLPTKVFDDAIVETVIIIFQNIKNRDSFDFVNIIENKIVKSENQSEILKSSNLNINENVQKNILDFKLLGGITDIIVGIATGDDKKYCRFEKLTDIDKPAIRGANISRYNINYTGEYIWYNRDQIIFDGNNKPKSSLKQAVGQSSPKKPADFEMPEKIVMQRISKKIIASLDTNQYYAHTSVVILKPKADNVFKNKYVLAILNSSYINFWLRTNSSNVSINVGTVNNIPIKIESIENQNKYEHKVDLILTLSKDLQEQSHRFQRTIQRKFELEDLPKKLQDWYKLPYSEFIKELAKKKVKLSLSQEAEWEDYFIQESKKALDLKSKIDQTDKEIDRMVYELYGLTQEEIQIISDATS